MKHLSSEQLKQYREDGYMVIPDFLSQDEVRRTQDGIQKVILKRKNQTSDQGGFNLEKVGDENFNAAAKAKEAGLFRKIQGAALYVPEIRDIFTGKKTLDVMEDLMGPDLYYHSSKVMFKPANGGAPKPWHQDAAYWRQYDPRQITIWIALDDATEENGCVWAIPGSHKLGHIPHVHQELQVEESRIDLKKAIPVPVKSGGLLIFDSLVLHMSKKNTSDKNRCAIICDYDSLPNPAIDMWPDDPGQNLSGIPESKVWALRHSKKSEALSA